MKDKQNKKEKEVFIPYYLQKAGFSPQSLSAVFESTAEAKEKKYKKQKKKYGFDERETWNMEKSFYEWLYQHLSYYKDHATQNHTPAYIYADGSLPEAISKQKAIEIILKSIEICITKETHMPKETMQLFEQILPDLWW